MTEMNNRGAAPFHAERSQKPCAIPPVASQRRVPDRERIVNKFVPARAFQEAAPTDTSLAMARATKAMKMGEWVKAVREFNHLTQEEFAEKLGMGRSAIAKWEIGIQEPNRDSYRKLIGMASPELKRAAPDASAFGASAMDSRSSAGMSDPSGKLASIRKSLGDALARRAKADRTVSGEQVLAVQALIDKDAHRLSGAPPDEEAADFVVEMYLKHLEPQS